METAALLAGLLFALLSTSPAQDVRAVDHYISDTAPVAGIGVGEVVPARTNAPRRSGTPNSRMPEATSRTSPPVNPPYISKDTEHTISYVEDVLAGRADVSKGVQDAVFEPGGRVAERPTRPVTSTGYSRVGAPDSVSAGHGTRDDSRGSSTTHSRDDHRNTGTPRRPDEGTRTVVSGSPRESTRDSGTGYQREETRSMSPPRVVNSQHDGGSSRTSLSGSPREDDRGVSTPVRSPQPAVRDYPREDGPVYTRKEQATVSSHGSHSGNGGKDIRDPVRTNSNSNKWDTAVNPPRDSMAGRDWGTSNDRRGDNAFDNSRDTSVGHSRNDEYDSTRDESGEYSRDRVVGHSQDNHYDNSRGTAGGHSMGTVTGHSRDTIVSHSRAPVVDHSRDTIVDHSRDTVVEHSHVPIAGHSRETFVDKSEDDIEVPYKPTTAVHHRESSNSWDSTYENSDEKSERDSELERPQEYPRGESVEEPIYASKDSGSVESFSFDSEDEDDEDIEVAHSTRPLPKAQRPRDVPDRRGARGPHPASPCPSVFSYEGTRAGKERWYGVVLVTTDQTLTGLRLEIRLDKRADLLGTWLGEVSSVDNFRYTIWNGRRRVEPGPPLSVKIFVKYSDQEYEPPRVRSIRLNGRQICPTEKGTPAVVPKPPAKPPNRPTQATNRPTQAANRPTQATNRPTQATNRPTQATNRPTQATNRPSQQGTRPVQRPNRPVSTGVQNPSRPHGTTSPQHELVIPSISAESTAATELVDGVACGRIEVQPSPLITYGQRTARGQWPWHAAIYQSKGTDLSYICGGSLIGKRTVLTAAHCVSRRYIDRPVDPESLVVYFGKYHLKLWSEGGVQDKQVLEVHVHPEYNSTDFRADIAILILSSPVEFTVYVKPVCLWDKNRPQLNEVEGHEGVVVGWGYDESGMVTEDLMMAKMPVVSQQTCIWSYPQFFSHFTSDRTYCAGFRNGTSVCNGDSGGGMVFPKTTGVAGKGMTTTWALRGIVSLSTSQANKRICNTDHYVVFTDVVQFYGWMNKYH